MVITTLEQAMAGMQPVRTINKGGSQTAAAGQWFSSFTYPGTPDAGQFDTTTAGGVALVQSNNGFSMVVTGCIPHYDPPSGKTAYLANFGLQSPADGGIYVLADRLWHCGANTTGTIVTTATGVQTIDSVAWPARDNNGSANGAGVMVGVEVTITLSAVVPTFTITYVNSDGVVGLSTSNLNPVPSGSTATQFHPFDQNNGDRGVQNVTTFQSSTSSAVGSYGLVAYRPIVQIDCPAGDSVTAGDLLSGGFPQIYNGACPFILFLSLTTGQWSPFGYYQETWG